jgi:hypothetical protein
MAELGSAASINIAKLCELTLKVLGNLYRYYNDVGAAPVRSKELRDELGAMSGLLQQLEDAIKADAINKCLESALGQYRIMIDDMERRTTPDQTSGIRRLKWPFKQDENVRFLQSIERHKSTFLLALNLGHR